MMYMLDKTIPWMLCLQFLCALSIGSAQTRIDPRASNYVTLQEAGRMSGFVQHPIQAEEFGHRIIPLGDIDGDSLADWAIQHFRSDTLVAPWFGGSTTRPVETILYRGKSGQVPNVGVGERIGPTEIASETWLLGAGDFDADGYRDLVAGIRLVNDSSEASYSDGGYSTGRVVVFWGHVDGKFGVSD